MLDAVVEIVKRERDTYPGTPALVAECRDALERCLFDRDSALAVLRGEYEVDDQPWSRCPECECDTYFQLRIDAESRSGSGIVPLGPLMMFVCEACQHTALRARATVHDGPWWEKGQRLRAKPEEIGHPYRGDVEQPVVDDEQDEDEENDDEPVPEVAVEPVEWSERRVCPDGACIGLIGETGECNVCGRSEQPAS